jgi:hypothetical protein
MKLPKTLIKFAIFLVIIGGFGIWLFRAMDASDKNKNESAAISTVLTIKSALNTFGDCGSLKELVAKGLIEPKLGNNVKAGYFFTITKTENKCEITARPESSSKGTRSFYSTNEDNWKIHASDNIEIVVDKNSPVLETRPNY